MRVLILSDVHANLTALEAVLAATEGSYDELWNLVECRRCSLGYLNPRPTVDEIGRYYPEVYFARRTSMARRYALQA